nr:hypothetical protein [Bacteroidia bacterium]
VKLFADGSIASEGAFVRLQGGNVVANLGVRVSACTGAFLRLGDDGVNWLSIKNSINTRLTGKQGWTLKYTDAEIQMMCTEGRNLNLSSIEIEDIILNGCRPDKTYVAADLVAQMNYWLVVKQRGYPNLFQSLQDYDQFSLVVKQLAQEWNLPTNSIYVQGSTLRESNAAVIGDIDVAIKVDAATFDNLVERFKNATTVKQAAIEADRSKGIIRGTNMHTSQSNRTFTGVFYDNFQSSFGIEYAQKFQGKGFQISIIKENSPIDVSPYLKIN